MCRAHNVFVRYKRMFSSINDFNHPLCLTQLCIFTSLVYTTMAHTLTNTCSRNLATQLRAHYQSLQLHYCIHYRTV